MNYNNASCNWTKVVVMWNTHVEVFLLNITQGAIPALLNKLTKSSETKSTLFSIEIESFVVINALTFEFAFFLF